MKQIIVYLLRLYQKLNFFPSRCRYYPTCSEYGVQAVDKYGAIKGLGLAGIRVLRCNQFFPGGVDPVR